ncbi:hypothetical protein [Aureivirga sp. CE67]|uniref:hypothetical protein n=1 Tax=Aureivirga sp. CE67 TaxID=1788983 RepID=UPI0018CB8CC3|nr:hypothetical protein [Aureivirga sp. CE67]
MKIELEELESTIKRKISFKYKPEFKETYRPTIKENYVIPLIIEVFNELEWEIVFTDGNSVEAKHNGDYNKQNEKITVVKKTSGSLEISSKSLNSNLTDFGSNSKRTGLFIALFKRLEKEYSNSGKLEELEKEYNSKYGWEDYEVPNELTPPNEFPKSRIESSIGVGLISSIIIGFVIGFLSLNLGYIIGLFEFGIGISIGYLFGVSLKKKNYLDFDRIRLLLIGFSIISFISSQYSQYLIILSNNDFSISFFEFISLKINNGLKIKELNLGWIGLLVSWGIQLVLPIYIAQVKTLNILMNYQIEKIPEDVITFVCYCLEQDKDLETIRAELSERGWKKESEQDQVFIAIDCISGINESKRE